MVWVYDKVCRHTGAPADTVIRLFANTARRWVLIKVRINTVQKEGGEEGKEEEGKVCGVKTPWRSHSHVIRVSPLSLGLTVRGSDDLDMVELQLAHECSKLEDVLGRTAILWQWNASWINLVHFWNMKILFYLQRFCTDYKICVISQLKGISEQDHRESHAQAAASVCT